MHQLLIKNINNERQTDLPCQSRPEMPINKRQLSSMHPSTSKLLSNFKEILLIADGTIQFHTNGLQKRLNLVNSVNPKYFFLHLLNQLRIRCW